MPGTTATPATPTRTPCLPAARRVGALGALLAAAALTVSGCGAGADATTNEVYQPGEGAIATVGDVAVRNLVLVADGEGSGVLIGSLVMLPLGTDAPPDADPPGDEFEAAEGEGAAVDFDAPVVIPPVSRVTLGVDDDQVAAVVDELAATPGQVVPVSLLFRDAGEVTLDVIVVDNEDGPYEGIVPPAPARA
jgi:hypothetical protein